MCDLCELKIVTKAYVRSKHFIVLDCKNCKVPMIVIKRHTTELNQEELIDLMWILHYLWEDGIKGELDQERRAVPGHWHAHIR